MKKTITIQYFAELVAKIVNDPIFSGTWPKGGYKITIERVDTGRTPTQNNCMHLFFEQEAIALNASGYDQVKVIDLMREGVELAWSKYTIKENLWRPFQIAMFGIDSTTGINTVEPNEIHRNLHRWMSSKGLPCVAWPDRFNR